MVDRYRNYQPRRKPVARRKPRRKLLTLVVIALVFFGGRAVWARFQQQTEEPTRTNATNKPEKPVKAVAISNSVWNELNEKIPAVLAQHQDLDIGVGIVDVQTNTSANYGVQESFHGASTTKVLTATAYLHDVEQGKRTLAENLGGGSAETHIRRMINRSDNNSWEILNRAVGYARLDSYARSIGINSYKYYGNLMTTSDQALLLNKLFKQELLNTSHTQLLLSFMQNTNNEDMIPQVAPGGKLYHKYGHLDDRLHDAAIIDYQERPIILVIFTKGKGDGNVYSVRTGLIQEIAKTVFNTVYPN